MIIVKRIRNKKSFQQKEKQRLKAQSYKKMSHLKTNLHSIKVKSHFLFSKKITTDGKLSRCKGQSQIPTQCFFKTNGHETLGIFEGFGARGPFSSGTYLLPMAGRDK